MLNPQEARKIQERGLDFIASQKRGFEFTNTFFPYTSGEIGPYYVRAEVVQNNSANFRTAIKDTCHIIRDALGKEHRYAVTISGGESRDWVFSLPASNKLDLSHLMIYKDGKLSDTDLQGRQLFHIADLNNEGSSPRDIWVPVIKRAGGSIKDIFFYVDRMEGGVQVMEELGLTRYVAVPLDAHAWDYLQKAGKINAETYRDLRERGTTTEQRNAWARAMLRSRKGLETLAGILNYYDVKSAEKGLKVLNKGYPDMKQELVESMNQQKLLWSRVYEDLRSGQW